MPLDNMSSRPARAPTHKPGRGTSADMKSKSRLAGLAPGENIKEKQVRKLAMLTFLFKLVYFCLSPKIQHEN